MKNNGYIDKRMFSVYAVHGFKFSQMEDADWNTDNIEEVFYQMAGHIKFGGYDETGMLPKSTFEKLQSTDPSKFMFDIQDVKIGDHTVVSQFYTEKRVATFILDSSFIFIPRDDFKILGEKMEQIYGEKICDETSGECTIKKACKDIPVEQRN